jgi:hypothetical protein
LTSVVEAASRRFLLPQGPKRCGETPRLRRASTPAKQDTLSSDY